MNKKTIEKWRERVAETRKMLFPRKSSSKISFVERSRHNSLKSKKSEIHLDDVFTMVENRGGTSEASKLIHEKVMTEVTRAQKSNEERFDNDWNS